MRESRTYGSVRGALSNERPYRDRTACPSVSIGCSRLFVTELVAIKAPQPLATFLADGGYLPQHVLLLRRVLALPGQTVCRDHLTVTVDQIEMGAARDHDSRGYPMPIWQGCRVIADGEVFLMNWQSADSLDWRYFGVLPISAIIGKAVPLWTSRED